MTPKPITTEDLREALAPIMAQLAKNDKILTGNGDPKTGVVYILATTVDRLAEVEQMRAQMLALRAQVDTLDRTSIVLWARRNPRAAWFAGVGVFALNSMINWSGVRKPVIHSILKAVGIDIPLAEIP